MRPPVAPGRRVKVHNLARGEPSVVAVEPGAAARTCTVWAARAPPGPATAPGGALCCSQNQRPIGGITGQPHAAACAAGSGRAVAAFPTVPRRVPTNSASNTPSSLGWPAAVAALTGPSGRCVSKQNSKNSSSLPTSSRAAPPGRGRSAHTGQVTQHCRGPCRRLDAARIVELKKEKHKK